VHRATISGVSANPNTIWPPKNKMVNVTINYSVASTCSSTCTLSVATNEPGPGQWDVVERTTCNGNGTGRTIPPISCSNSGATSQAVLVTVPHEQGK
jgi:hypothetical protein